MEPFYSTAFPFIAQSRIEASDPLESIICALFILVLFIGSLGPKN